MAVPFDFDGSGRAPDPAASGRLRAGRQVRGRVVSVRSRTQVGVRRCRSRASEASRRWARRAWSSSSVAPFSGRCRSDSVIVTDRPQRSQMGFCIPLPDTGYPRRMPIVSRGDDEDDESTAATGAPPAFDIDFDPNDPDQVKVHYNLTGWSLDQRSELAETLAERGVPHVWAGDELVVPEQIEPDVDALFDELEREIGPFPVPLLDGDDDDEPLAITQFELDEWPVADVELLQKSLNEAEIPHRWERRTLLVASDAEHTVDELLDAIEAGEVASLDESAEAPDGALHELYVNADRLARDPVDGSA